MLTATCIPANMNATIYLTSRSWEQVRQVLSIIIKFGGGGGTRGVNRDIKANVVSMNIEQCVIGLQTHKLFFP